MKPNIFFLVIDSLRADKTSGKNKSSFTPNLDLLISQGTYFNQAISTADQTGLSLGSLVTSLYPFKSGISYFNFDHNIPNFFNLLKNEGYDLNSFVPDLSFFKKMTEKFSQNEYYVYDKKDDWLRLIGLGNKIIEKFNQMDKPWFYFVHLMDIRPPYSLPPEFDHDEYGETKYDRMLSYIDSWLGKFFKKIDLDNTIFILTADHGDYISVVDEDLNEIKIPGILKKTNLVVPSKITDKFLSKLQKRRKSLELKNRKASMLPEDFRTLQNRCDEFLFDELLRIPLVFTGFNVPSKLVIDQQVRQVDIFPTIFDLAGFSERIECINGKSLVPLLNNQTLSEEFAYIETGSSSSKDLGKLIGIRTSQYKYLRSRYESNNTVVLYDLKKDPNEINNIAKSNPEIIKNMENQLIKIRDNSSIDNSIKISNNESKKVEDELRKMGYI